MRDELLAYLLGDIDLQQRSRVEERLKSDPIWQHELERLRSYVEEAQGADGDETEGLPENLVHRTCEFVTQASAQGALSPAVLPASLTESQDASGSSARRWSRLDLAVAAGILVVVGSLMIPALRESRDSARRQQCQNNLRSLGMALASYADRFGGQLPAIDRDENAGMFAVKLHERGALTRKQLAEWLLCPASQFAEDVFRGTARMHVPTRQELSAAQGEKLAALLKNMGGSFAYRVGYVDAGGRYHQVEFVGSSQAPMMADKPSSNIVGFQSENHGGCGQNVLFQDQSVRYIQFCSKTNQDENWYLNADNQHAAGKHAGDVVMIRSETSPAGKVTLSFRRQ